MEKVLNFVEDPDVVLLDRVVETVYRGSPQERDLAQRLLTKLQEHPNMWQRVDTILEFSKSQSTKFYALQILESLIKYRWKMLPRDQCNAIKGYIVSLIVKLSGSEDTAQNERLFLQKLNLILIGVIKHEWPKQWESFVPEITASSQSSESVCENNLRILKLLSEEVFDFSNGQMTQAKIAQLKESLTKDFSLIYQLIERILIHSVRAPLVLVALQTLHRYLSWIPLGFIFETKLIDMLVYKFLPVPQFRNITLKCLTEIGSLSVGNVYDAQFAKLYCLTIQAMRSILPLETDIAAAYEQGNQAEQDFVEDLAVFLTSFYRSHLAVAELPDYQQFLLEGHAYVVKISLVSDNEIFKICLEHWNALTGELYNETPFLNTPTVTPRRAMYAATLSRVRLVIIGRMAKPEEVLIVEDDNGEIVRENTKDVDAIILYKTMRETLIYLTHLDPDDTQNIMLEKMRDQMNGREWSWHNLNTLCWAVGSISGAMNEDEEKKFLVTVIKDLLGLCEQKRGKDNKAVVASNIMYVVGQYPRFLRAHWKFLKTVVNKLFEFMHELHPGVQDMACDTFLKISQKCRRKFVVVQVGESVAFIDEILNGLGPTISELSPSQIHTFYEAVGCMISSHNDPEQRDALLLRLMYLPNTTWSEVMAQAAVNLEFLRSPDIAKSLANILKTNSRAAMSLGHCYIVQLGRIFMDMMNVYGFYSDSISQLVATGGPHATSTSNVRALRSVKKETLKLLEAFISRSEDPAVVYPSFVAPLLQTTLVDYKSIRPEIRDAEVLALLAAIVAKLRAPITGDVPRMLDHVFEPTLAMITQNFDDFPEHRMQFFTLIRAINLYCFPAFFMISQQSFKLVIDSIVWGFKHPTRDIAELGMWILLELWKNISQSEVAQPFYQSYMLRLLTDLFGVLTDTFHKAGLKLHASMLMQMISAVESGQVLLPLWPNPPTAPPPPAECAASNAKFLREHLTQLLGSSFQHVSAAQIQLFVAGLFAHCRDLPAFKQHLRDFLVQLREFVDKDNSELYADEQEAQATAIREAEKKKLLIPGMVAPQNQPNWNADLDML